MLRCRSFRRRDTRLVWRRWRTGGRCRRRFLSCRCRWFLSCRCRWFLTCCRRFLSRGASHDQHRNDAEKIQSISPTHQVLRACNQQVAASSQQKERLSPHGDRRAHRESPGGLSQPPGLLRSEKHVRQFLTSSIFRARTADISRPVCVARAANNGARKRPASRCQASAPNVARAHQSSVSPDLAAPLWCESLTLVPTKRGYRANY
jgi:hypothetical protein